jgi:hypothetical protein
MWVILEWLFEKKTTLVHRFVHFEQFVPALADLAEYNRRLLKHSNARQIQFEWRKSRYSGAYLIGGQLRMHLQRTGRKD